MSQIELLSKPPVGHAVIFVCEKCGKHVAKASGGEENAARSLQKAIKREAKKIGDKRSVRAVLTSCMDICPDDAMAIAIGSIDQPTRFALVSAEEHNDDFEQAARELMRIATKIDARN